MNTGILITRTIANFASRVIYSIAFFPASAVGDEIGNYAVASAGTIVNKNSSDDTGNLNTATESVCPRGWTLPTTKQIDNNTDTSNFNPVLGGIYIDSGVLASENTNGTWWGSTAYSGAQRYRLRYNDGSLHTGSNRRFYGLYIRCVSEEKTVTDLTYLQDMTGEIANNTTPRH